MELCELPAEGDAIRRYVEELWLPYHGELAGIVDRHELAEDVDLVAEEVEFRLERLAEDDVRVWVAVDPGPELEADGPFGDPDAELVGYVAAEVVEPPPVYDRPQRLFVNDLYVRENHRGTGLARDLLERAAAWGREAGCAELALEVDVDNERAIAFYEKLGFEPAREKRRLPIEEL